MKLKTLAVIIMAIAMAPGLAIGEKYKGNNFLNGSISSREIQDGTIEATKISEESLSIQSPKIDLGDSVTYIDIPLTHMTAGTAASPVVTDVLTDANVTFKARCFNTNSTNLQTLDIYPEAFANGSTMRGEDSATNLLSSTAITSKQLFGVVSLTTNGPRLDAERTPVFFVALNGTIYYMGLSSIVNMPNQTGQCSFKGFIMKINPEV
jgi:hypothetical protein